MDGDSVAFSAGSLPAREPAEAAESTTTAALGDLCAAAGTCVPAGSWWGLISTSLAARPALNTMMTELSMTSQADQNCLTRFVFDTLTP